MMSRLIICCLFFALAMPAWAAEFRKLEPVAPPALAMKDLGGREHALSAYKGQVVLVNFWASWCPPCRKEMPSLQRLTQKMMGKPFVVLAVDSGESREEAAAFLKDMPADFPILPDPEGAEVKRWKVFAMPTSFLIDKRGQVRYALPGGTEWDDGEGLKLIGELLAE